MDAGSHPLSVSGHDRGRVAAAPPSGIFSILPRLNPPPRPAEGDCTGRLTLSRTSRETACEGGFSPSSIPMGSSGFLVQVFSASTMNCTETRRADFTTLDSNVQGILNGKFGIITGKQHRSSSSGCFLLPGG